MHATVNGSPVPLEKITLDEFGWEKTGNQGSHNLVLHFSETDLISIGSRVLAYARECIDEEPKFFQEESMADVPKPDSASIFAVNPRLLSLYLEEPFWSRTTMLAILDSMNVVQCPTPRFWIENFRRFLSEKDAASYEFGVVISE